FRITIVMAQLLDLAVRKTGSASQQALVNPDHPPGILCPTEFLSLTYARHPTDAPLVRLAISLPEQRDCRFSPGRDFSYGTVHRRVSANLPQSRNIAGKYRSPACHGFNDRQPEALALGSLRDQRIPSVNCCQDGTFQRCENID